MEKYLVWFGLIWFIVPLMILGSRCRPACLRYGLSPDRLSLRNMVLVFLPCGTNTIDSSLNSPTHATTGAKISEVTWNEMIYFPTNQLPMMKENQD